MAQEVGKKRVSSLNKKSAIMTVKAAIREFIVETGDKIQGEVSVSIIKKGVLKKIGTDGKIEHRQEYENLCLETFTHKSVQTAAKQEVMREMRRLIKSVHFQSSPDQIVAILQICHA